MGRLQTALAVIYPHQCVLCDAMVEAGGGLCGPCWRDMPFIRGLTCDCCGTPLPGESPGAVHCDTCITDPPAWSRGRAALVYRDNGRRLVLSLKHGDRLDIVRPAAAWMARALTPVMAPGQVPEQIIVPVPAHWRRLISRRYNQAALLAQALGRIAGQPVAVQALTRVRRTRVQDGMTRAERFANLDGAIAAHPRHGRLLAGKRVLLVDDVMTTGATLSAAAEAARAAGAVDVCVGALARVARDD